MISPVDVYHVLAATVPLYVAMLLGYVSYKWCKLFTPDQCSGINKFVAKFSIPLLSFHVISANNPYQMNVKFILADLLQKIFSFLILFVINKLSSIGSFDWIITGFSLSTQPNTLVVGIPLLTAMYGNKATMLLAQTIGLQSLIWYNLLLFLFEYRASLAAVTTQLQTSEEIESPQRTQLKRDEEQATGRALRRNQINLILLTVGRKLILNPNTHATLAGIIWATISFRWKLELPLIVAKSISILTDGGLGMAMFSLGLFMATQNSIVACGFRLAILAIGTRFLIGPALMIVASITIGLRGTLFRIAIVQAALPQGIVPFVFAKEYNVHPDILSTGLIIGMIIAIPVALPYYFLLEL
ncbi:hypothetical protein Sjap_023816 [Stephania japonica]|uniref:Auxin efflux carrier component n=1 Tax=Stephania japonica TaxID=461633 RepID=A0AAP0EKX3_9MAGN